MKLAVVIALAGCVSRPGYECDLETHAPQLEATLGVGGGDAQPLASCAPNEVVTGMTFVIEADADISYNEHLTVSATMTCTRYHATDFAYAASSHEVLAGAGYHTPLEDPVVGTCPPGTALVGMHAHIVAPAGNLFNSITLDCAALGGTGAPDGAITAVEMPATGKHAVDHAVACDPGEAVVGFLPHAGAELDQIQLQCAQLDCP